ncbi:head-tail adaptor protein [Romboutsia ilealis]|uniref:Phage head closure protein n=1 Tax=Romboutsia faecis TaxID=2764597 RepID=A0ABR7JN92_9FIRM|nr:phage head closure protein [Romboutsia faecis]MBC5996374.1 phage head closure protein [Romboutsia faecis]MRN24990.1 head-tail adaptor protein [Romboutsia ilealis]
MVYNRPIIIQKLNEDTEEWSDYLRLRSSINKSKGSEYLSSGTVQYSQELVFNVRYCTPLKEISLNTQQYRIVFEDVIYDIEDYDDYMLKHKNVKLLGAGRHEQM